MNIDKVIEDILVVTGCKNVEKLLYNSQMPSETEDFHIKLEETVGGEGQGDQYYEVYKFIDKKSAEIHYVRFDAYYSSSYGVEYDGSYFLAKKVPVEAFDWVKK